MPDPIDGNPTPDGAQAPAKTFTQAELDQIIKDRLGREREKYADYDSLKASASKLKDMEAANLSEAEKVAKAIADRDARLAELETKASKAEERALGLIRQTKTVAIASNLGAYDATDANFVSAVAGIDPASSTADADIQKAIEALKASKPYLFKPATAGARTLESFNPGGQGSQQAETDAQRAARVLRSSQGVGRGFGPLG